MNLLESGKTILVVGDLMLDEYVIGDNYRISDEAPVPILKVGDFKVALGGAANVAHNLVCLGCTPLLCGIIGHGDGALRGGFSARRFMNLINSNGLSSDLIVSSQECVTTTKTRVLINQQQVVRYDYEHLAISDNVRSLILQSLESIDYSKVDMIIVSDYNKGVISKSVMDVIKHKNIRIIVDPKPDNYDLYSDVFCITPNILEFNKLRSIDSCPDNKLEGHAKSFVKEYQLDCIVITLGTRGAFYCDAQSGFFSSGSKKEVANIIGAGDTFVSVLGLAFACSVDAPAAVMAANVGSGIVVSKKYTSTCSISELRSEIE